MGELLPDSWYSQEQEEQKCCQQRQTPWRGPVSDILLWVECFSTLVSVLSTRYLQKTPQLMAYQQTILKAHRFFMGDGWMTYDTCYNRKAEILKTGVSLSIMRPWWARQNPSLIAGTVSVSTPQINTFTKRHQPAKWKLITDLLYAEGQSVNDVINKCACSKVYISVRDIANAAVSLGKEHS